MAHLKDGFYLTVDDVQTRLIEEMENLVDATWDLLITLQNSEMGQVVTSSLDEVLTRTEEAVSHYLPLPPTLRESLNWKLKVIEFTENVCGS